jgi:hypothetical protein
MSTPSKKRVVRRFNPDPCQGMAALVAGSSAEGLPFKSMTRKGNKAVVVYER